MPHMEDVVHETSLPHHPVMAHISDENGAAGGSNDVKDVDMAEANKAAAGNADVEELPDDFTRYRLERSQYSREHAVQLQAKNRRKRYLELHPDYFDDESLEVANPKLHYNLVLRFQKPAEREAQGRLKTPAEQLTANLWRTETENEMKKDSHHYTIFARDVAKDGELTKEEARAWWVDVMTQRFLSGEDSDFDYRKVDGNVKYDDPEEERDAQEAYFDSMDSDFDSDGEGKEKVLTGETGIQDY